MKTQSAIARSLKSCSPVFLLAVLTLFSGKTTHAQSPGPARTISLAVDRTMVVAGEQIQVRVRTRDVNGLARPADIYIWASTNPTVMTIDSNGVATAVGLGVTTISATYAGLRGVVTMQVLPMRVDVLAPQAKMFVGEELQLAAVALDINAVPIPNVAFRWDLTGANGFITRAATISNTGLLRAIANALVTSRATIAYTGVQANQLSEFSGLTHVLIEPRIDFKLTSLLANSPVERTFKILPSFMNMGGNDLGQIAFVAPLDGISDALLLYDAGKLQVMATAGLPGPQPGSFVWAFQNPSVNNKGQALVRFDSRGACPCSGLMLATRDGISYPFLEGQSFGGIQRMVSFTTTRYSINDKGDILFRADFQYSGSRTPRSGLFKLTDGNLQVLQTSDSPLPGLGSTYTFGFFGLAQDGTAVFSASDGTRSALYRLNESYELTKIIGTSDSLGGSRVNTFGSWTGIGISANGTVAFSVALANGTSGVARLRAGESQIEVTILKYGAYDVFTVAANGDVLFTGGDDSGWGLHVWGGPSRNNAIRPALISNVTLDGGSIWTYYDAFITQTGEVYVHLITSNNDLAIVRGSGPTVVLKSGVTVNATVTFDFLNVIPGARNDSAPDITTGGQDVSILQWSASELTPLYLSGQRMPGSTSSSFTLSNAVRHPSGDLFLGNSAGVFRSSGSRIDALQRTQNNIASSASAGFLYKILWITGYYHGAGTLAVNQSGAAVVLAQAEREQVILYTDGSRSSVLGALGGPAPTPTPTGSFFNNWIWGAALAIDDAGRVMFGSLDRNGNQGLFLYENGKWRTAAQVNTTRIDGRVVTNVNCIQAANNTFYAEFGLTGGDIAIAQYNPDGSWTRLIGRGDFMPNGSDVNFIWPRFDVNRKGDIAYIVNMNSGQAIVVRTADGTNHFVYLTSDAEAMSPALVQFGNTSLDLRDNRRLYFTAIDALDRNVLLVAEPLF